MSRGTLIVGDLHGDWGRLNQLIQKKDPKEVWVVGDFGWWPGFEVRRATIYGQKAWTHLGIKVGNTVVRWIDGNHEDQSDLDSQGRIGRLTPLWVYENCLYQPRGSLLKLDDGRKVLFYGGAESIDKDIRTPGLDWFHREIPNQIELDLAMSHVHVDIVISHTCPLEWVPDTTRVQKLTDPTRNHLTGILQKYKPKLWYHGHWHHEATGVSGDTRWFALDYPGHGGRWWHWLPAV